MIIKETPFGDLVAVRLCYKNRVGIEIYLERKEIAARCPDKIKGAIIEHANGHLKQRLATVEVIDVQPGEHSLLVRTWDKPEYKEAWHSFHMPGEKLSKEVEFAAGGLVSDDEAPEFDADQLCVQTPLGALVAELTGDFLYPGIVVYMRHNGKVPASLAGVPYSENFIVSDGFLEQQLLLAEAAISDKDKGDEHFTLYLRTWDNPRDCDPFHVGKLETKPARYDVAAISAGDTFITKDGRWHTADAASCYFGDNENHIVFDEEGNAFLAEDFAALKPRPNNTDEPAVFTISRGDDGMDIKNQRYKSYNCIGVAEEELFAAMSALADKFNNELGIGIVFDVE